MSDSATLDLHTAIVARLEGDATLPKLFDEVPEETPMPYGSFGSPSAVPYRVLAANAQTDAVIIDWWALAVREEGSRTYNDGYLALMEIAPKVKDLLRQPIVLADHRVMLLKWVDDRYLRDPQPRVRHLQQEFRAITARGV